LVIPGCISSFAGSALTVLQLQTLSFSGISITYCICNYFVQSFSGQRLIRYFGMDVSVHIDSSVEVIYESCFDSCNSLASVTFDSNSRLSRLESGAFRESGLQSIHLPGSLEVICESCFSHCHWLTSITFDHRSRIRARVSDLKAGIPFDCRPLASTRDARTGGRYCSVN
jgi:hypothetical protein